jgi:hypothetical protein
MNTKRLIVLAAIETVAIALGVCLLLFAFRYTPPTSTPIPAPSKTWSPEQAGWPYPSPIAWEKYRPYFRKRSIQRAWPRTASNLRGYSRKWPTFPTRMN